MRGVAWLHCAPRREGQGSDRELKVFWETKIDIQKQKSAQQDKKLEAKDFFFVNEEVKKGRYHSTRGWGRETAKARGERRGLGAPPPPG